MHNLFQTENTEEESPLYSIHLDQVADKEYEDFLKCVDYSEENSESMRVINMYPGPKGL